jgi:hypothetical protein
LPIIKTYIITNTSEYKLYNMADLSCGKKRKKDYQVKDQLCGMVSLSRDNKPKKREEDDIDVIIDDLIDKLPGFTSEDIQYHRETIREILRSLRTRNINNSTTKEFLNNLCKALDHFKELHDIMMESFYSLTISDAKVLHDCDRIFNIVKMFTEFCISRNKISCLNEAIRNGYTHLIPNLQEAKSIHDITARKLATLANIYRPRVPLPPKY